MTNSPIAKSLARHRRKIRRHSGLYKASVRRLLLRLHRRELGLHPDWGLIGPFLPPREHRNWVRKRKRDQIRAARRTQGVDLPQPTLPFDLR